MSQPIDEFEAFEILQVIDPETFTDELYEDAGNYEEAVMDRYDVDVETFCAIAGDLLNTTPVISSSLTGNQYHAFGESHPDRRIFIAKVSREVES